MPWGEDIKTYNTVSLGAHGLGKSSTSEKAAEDSEEECFYMIRMTLSVFPVV